MLWLKLVFDKTNVFLCVALQTNVEPKNHMHATAYDCVVQFYFFIKKFTLTNPESCLWTRFWAYGHNFVLVLVLFWNFMLCPRTGLICNGAIKCSLAKLCDIVGRCLIFLDKQMTQNIHNAYTKLVGAAPHHNNLCNSAISIRHFVSQAVWLDSEVRNIFQHFTSTSKSTN